MTFQIAELQDYVDREMKIRSVIRILEAGCGSGSRFRFDKRAHWVGIDISASQLERNAGLDEKIRGDIQTYEFPAKSFDLIVCWDVLEHLSRPEAAMQRFVSAIKDGGLIVLKIPNVHSLKGMITKIMPHWWHVLWYRCMLGRSSADMVDGAPFKAYLRLAIAPCALRRFAARQGLQVPFSSYYDVSSLGWFRRKKLALFSYLGAAGLMRILSLGCLRESEFIIVMKKPQTSVV